MLGVSRRSGPGGGVGRPIPRVVVGAVAASVMLEGTLRVLLMAACDSWVTTVGESWVEKSYQ